MPMKVRYTSVSGEVIAETRNGVRKLYLPDPLGSTLALADSGPAPPQDPPARRRREGRGDPPMTRRVLLAVPLLLAGAAGWATWRRVRTSGIMEEEHTRGGGTEWAAR